VTLQRSKASDYRYAYNNIHIDVERADKVTKLFARGNSILGSNTFTRASELNIPLQFKDDLWVHTGDLLVGDQDGVVVVPPSLVEQVAAICAERKEPNHGCVRLSSQYWMDIMMEKQLAGDRSRLTIHCISTLQLNNDETSQDWWLCMLKLILATTSVCQGCPELRDFCSPRLFTGER
jgi:hypothetical protein